MSAFKVQPKFSPLKQERPNDGNLHVDGLLASYMERHVVLETDANMRKRNDILDEIRRIFITWIKQVAKEKHNMSEEEAQGVGGLIFVSGSHRLNVREPGADIDTVCVAPNFCTLEDFFSSLKDTLIKHSKVTELVPVETATVPMIGMEFSGISIDLLFARLAENTVHPELNIFDDSILHNLDPASEKALNGPRVTDMISQLVPNYDTFLIVLRCVRKWAKARGLYGNKLSYLGGVNFNILVAFITHLYPRGTPSFTLEKFFWVYKKWAWDKSPIELTEARVYDHDKDEGRVWTFATKRPHECFPIITPAYPAYNSSFNVSIHSRQVMMQEFERAWNILKSFNSFVKKKVTKKISTNQDDFDAVMDKLYQPSDFFVRYKHYIRCTAHGGNDEDEARAYMQFVESQIRLLVLRLDPLPIARPIHLHNVKYPGKHGNDVSFFIGFNADKAKLRGQKEIYIDKAINSFKANLEMKGEQYKSGKFTWEYYKWNKLPPSLFEPLGGKAEAKRMHREFHPPKSATAVAAAAEGEGATNDAHEGDAEAEGKPDGDAEDGGEGDGVVVGDKRTLEEAGLDDDGVTPDAQRSLVETEEARARLPAFLSQMAATSKIAMDNPDVPLRSVKWMLLSTT